MIVYRQLTLAMAEMGPPDAVIFVRSTVTESLYTVLLLVYKLIRSSKYEYGACSYVDISCRTAQCGDVFVLH